MPGATARSTGDAEGRPDDPGRERRLAWATLLRRTWDLEVLACPRCGERMELIATIEDERTARKILEHLGLPARPPPRPGPWRSGQQHLSLDDAPGPLDGVDILQID